MDEQDKTPENGHRAQMRYPTSEELVTEYLKRNRVQIQTALQLVTTVAVVGLLINNKRSLKFSKKIVQNMDKNVIQSQQIIKELKDTGQTFEFFPGVGIWVD